MAEKIITFENLNIDANLFFLGSDEEIERAEAKEEQRAQEIRKLIFSRDFIALEYYTEKGARRILHHSTRNGVLFQLSYIASDGVPVMHENYITTAGENDGCYIGSENELLRHFVNETLDSDLTARILTA